MLRLVGLDCLLSQSFYVKIGFGVQLAIRDMVPRRIDRMDFCGYYNMFVYSFAELK